MSAFDLSVMIQQIELLCKRDHISIQKMLLNAGLSVYVMDNLRKGSIPSVDKVIAIADYFHVSVETLIGRNSIEQEKTS